MSWLKNAFALDKESSRPLTEQEEAVLDKLARKVHQHGLAVPAILFLESVKPLNFVAGQVMVFFQPMVGAFFSTREYDLFTSLLERRFTLEKLLEKIEALENKFPSPPENASDGS